MARFCTQADLERALGGAQQLSQLLSKSGQPGIPDPALVSQVLDMASAEIASYIQVTVNLSTLTEPYPPVLVFKTAEAATFYAWRYGAYGQAVPEGVVQAHDKAIAWAQDVANKRATLGAIDKPGLDQPVGVVDHDAQASRLTDRPSRTGISIAAFKLGFR
jgi:phage gp36-like protein